MKTQLHHLRSILLGAALAFSSVSACGAQDEDLEQLPDPIDLIAFVRSAYRAGPIGEHVTVRVKDSIGRESTGRFRIFLNADPNTGEEALRIEFDPLQVSWVNGTLTAISERNETTFYQETLVGMPDLSTISAALRPIPLPQLELAFSSDRGLSFPTPYTPETNWTSATLGTLGSLGLGTEVVIIEGDSEGRAISFTIDPKTDRLRTMHAEIGPIEDPDGVTIDLEFRPIQPSPVPEWGIDTDRRTQVDQIIDLLPRRAPVRVGELAPRIALLRNRETVPWRLSVALQEAATRRAPPHALALILFRHDGDEQTQEEFVSAALRAVAAIDTVHSMPALEAADGQLIDIGVTEPWRILTQAGVVFRLGNYVPLVYRQLVDRWTGDSSERGILLWDPSSSRSIDWFDSDAGAVLVLVDLDQTLLLIEPLEAGMNSDELAAKVVAALRESNPAYSLINPPSDPGPDGALDGDGPPPPGS